MLSSLINKAQGFFKEGHERTLMMKKNVFYSFLIKGVGILTIFLVTRLTLHYVDEGQYGIWLTVGSLVNWINTFDLGLGHGLRNKMAYSLALNERDNIVKYISTTYAILFLISSVSFILLTLLGSFFDWNELLNVNKTVNYSIWPIVVISLATFCSQFFLQPVHTILIATHQQFKSSLIILVGQIATLIIICMLILFTKSSLIILVIVLGCTPPAVYLLATIYFFSTSLREYLPRFNAVDMKSAKSLMGTGSMFFFIQMSGLVLFETDNVVISKVLGPANVTEFNLTFRYLSLITLVFTIMIAPYWSAVTDAYAKKDMVWIKNSRKKMRLVLLGVCGLAVVLFLISPIFYKIWLDDKVTIPALLTFTMAIWLVLGAWQGIYTSLLNGIGKLKVQLIITVIAALINIPLSVVLLKWIGTAGAVIANIILLFIINVTLYYQVKLILDEKATGIWDK